VSADHLETFGQPGQPVDCLVQLRAHGEVHGCTAWLDGKPVRIRAAPLGTRCRAKGQAAVLYHGDTVLGSATISATSSARAVPGLR
jgi:tRNA-uridine 2-sulfurtransferase